MKRTIVAFLVGGLAGAVLGLIAKNVFRSTSPELAFTASQMVGFATMITIGLAWSGLVQHLKAGRRAAVIAASVISGMVVMRLSGWIGNRLFG